MKSLQPQQHVVTWNSKSWLQAYIPTGRLSTGNEMLTYRIRRLLILIFYLGVLIGKSVFQEFHSIMYNLPVEIRLFDFVLPILFVDWCETTIAILTLLLCVLYTFLCIIMIIFLFLAAAECTGFRAVKQSSASFLSAAQLYVMGDKLFYY